MCVCVYGCMGVSTYECMAEMLLYTRRQQWWHGHVLYAYVCMCVCVYVCMGLWAYGCMGVWVYRHMSVWLKCSCTHAVSSGGMGPYFVWAYVRMYVCVYVCTGVWCVGV